MNESNSQFSIEDLAAMGEGHVAYVKAFRSEDVQKVFPHAPELKPGSTIFALIGANGAPIMLTDDRDTAITNAWDHELTTVSVH
jgi:hypothetical protein